MECTAILGQRQEFADGVHDYCCYLRHALAEQGVTLTLKQVNWAEIGHKGSRRELLEAVHDESKPCLAVELINYCRF